MRNKVKTLSHRAKLLLNYEEGYDVDWKREISGLDSQDIVAFANSEKGGSILIGVEETKDNEGRQRANILGCACNEESKRNILSKAQNCIPSIEVEIIIENTDKKSFYRIEIPSGEHKPYCTQKGVYKIRDDGHNKAITPNKMLSMFIEIEGDEFLKRFKEAGREIKNNISDLSGDINEALEKLEEIIPQIEAMEELNYIPDEILGYVEKIHSEIGDIDSTTNWNEKRIITLLNHFDIEDPKITNLKQMFKQSLNRYNEDGKDITKDNFLERMEKIYFGATKEQLKLWRDEFILENKNQERDLQ